MKAERWQRAMQRALDQLKKQYPEQHSFLMTCFGMALLVEGAHAALEAEP